MNSTHSKIFMTACLSAASILAGPALADAELTIPQSLRILPSPPKVAKPAVPATIDLQGVGLYAAEGYRLRFRYKEDGSTSKTTLDTTRPSVTVEETDDGEQVVYRTIKAGSSSDTAADEIILLESVTRHAADGSCYEAYTTNYEWLATLPAQTHTGAQIQRVAKVTDFDHEQPCGVPNENQPPIESIINVSYTVLGPATYSYGDVNIKGCVKLAERAPDYSGFAILCRGVGTAYRLRTGPAYGKRERRLVNIIEQPLVDQPRIGQPLR